MNTTIEGERAFKFSRWNGDGVLTSKGHKVRLFDIYSDSLDVGDNAVWVGSTTSDYDYNFLIDICYLNKDDHTDLALNDFQKIRHEIYNYNFVTTGFNFAILLQPSFDVGEDDKYKYLKIPVLTRVSVTEG